MIAPNIQDLTTLINECIQDSGLKVSDLFSVEMVGCGTRIPAIMEASMKAFNTTSVARTLHSDEAVARGCSLTAAMLLPTFHTSKFEVEECNGIPVDITWSIHDGGQKSKTLFPVKSNFPTVKSMTFDGRTEPMEVLVSYTEGTDQVIHGIPTLLSWYKIEIPKAEHEKFSLKLRVKIDQNQIPSLDTAELIENYKEEKKIPIKSAPPVQKEVKEGEAPAATPVPEQSFETKIVDKERATQIHFKFEQHGFSQTQINDFIQ